MHSSAIGVDYKLYFGGFGLRHYTGGGFGWYDPRTQKMDGFWKPLSGYAVQWLAPALGGKLMVISTITAADELNNNQAPSEARLFVYDVLQQKLIREITPVPKAPKYVRGLVNLRGETITVFDLGIRLGLAPRDITEASHNVVLKSQPVKKEEEA